VAEELGTKDVLEQVHTRLGTLEQDVRALDSKVDARFDRVLTRVDERFERVHEEIGGMRSDMHKRFEPDRSHHRQPTREDDADDPPSRRCALSNNRCRVSGIRNELQAQRPTPLWPTIPRRWSFSGGANCLLYSSSRRESL